MSLGNIPGIVRRQIDVQSVAGACVFVGSLLYLTVRHIGFAKKAVFAYVGRAAKIGRGQTPALGTGGIAGRGAWAQPAIVVISGKNNFLGILDLP